MDSFSSRIIAWQKHAGRHNLPWQQQVNRYRVWVSEIMLQQTQVATVIPYFERFMQRFPDVESLATAPADDVLAHWAGLGYYARARNLQKAAIKVLEDFGGKMPEEADELEGLPGIGRSTAAAIVSLSDGVALPILDGNVKRVFARHASIDSWTGATKTQKQLWALAEERMPEQSARAYNQGLMDLGSQLCTRSKPQCQLCPVAEDCLALAQGRTQELPVPKPKKSIPTKTAAFLVLLNAKGELLLQRRPPSGIWGGLWCLPQHDDLDALKASVSVWQNDINQIQALPTLQHVFSHYKLTLQPYQLRLGATSKTLTIAENSERFVRPEMMSEYGLPAPIEKLLRKHGLHID
ncbi:MAG: A/G-specific adenine glycosylase [Gammaproteobacteria bacterium]|nr:A/G-specific adenine glycosylase [Gammaproteobacteria bacterium]